MAIITIKSPPDGNDVSTTMVTRLAAVLPQGMTIKDLLIALGKFYVRQKELGTYRTQQTQTASTNVQAKNVELTNDPDVGGIDL